MTITEQESDIDKATRDNGRKALATVITHVKNCEIFEKKLFKKSANEEMYRWVIYQVIGQLILDKKNMKGILKAVKGGKIGWNDPTYDEPRERLDENYDYLTSPFEIVEGVVECPKCKGMKTWSVQKQTRGGDEPMTTFSKCATSVKVRDHTGKLVDGVCGHEFIYSG